MYGPLVATKKLPLWRSGCLWWFSCTYCCFDLSTDLKWHGSPQSSELEFFRHFIFMWCEISTTECSQLVKKCFLLIKTFSTNFLWHSWFNGKGCNILSQNPEAGCVNAGQLWKFLFVLSLICSTCIHVCSKI